MQDKNSFTAKTLEGACIYVPHQVNNMSMVHGFSPSQWVFGKTPAANHSLTAELFNPGVDGIDGIDEESKFADIQKKRVMAQKAWITADSDAKLRRAMNKIFKEYKDEVQIGQQVWFWRKQGSGILQKAKWRGPARVVAKEVKEEGKVLVIWLTHGASLVRCSPHQVRPMAEHQGCVQPADPDAALKDLQELRARSTTQFRDVTEADPTIEDMADDEFEYEPSIADDGEAEGAGRPLVLPLPGVVTSLLTHGEVDVDRERTPRRRRMSEEEPEPTPTQERDDPGDDDDPGNDGPAEGGTESKKRKKTAGQGGSGQPQPRDQTSGPASGSGGPAPRDQGGVDVPIPEMIEDDELMVEDVYLSEVQGLPNGWIIVDGDIELADAWVVQHLRRNEANEKVMNANERALMMEAKQKELGQFFSNDVWQFAKNHELKDKSRVVTARWVLTWKIDESTGLPKAKARLVLRG